MPEIDHFWAVVPAGGSGTRLWPLSRASSPKFLHDLTGSGTSLLQQTVARVSTLAGERIVVVTGAAHRDQVAAQLADVPQVRVVAEPSPRDSMAAIGYAAALLERQDPEAVLASFAADHVISDVALFEGAVTLAAEVARADWLVTIGIRPTGPSTAFGYVRQGAALAGHDGAFVVEEFVEKPALDVARGYLAEGSYRWNAGMFVVRPRVLLDLLAQRHPGFAASLRDLAETPERIEEVWPTLPRIAIDHAVAEPAAADGRVATVPGEFAWDDIGDFRSLSEVMAAGDQADGEPLDGQPGSGAPVPAVQVPAVQVLGDADLVRSESASGLVVPGSGRLIALVGIEDVVVVDTPDAVLVTTRAQAQQVKAIVDRLRETGRADLT